MPPSHSSPGLSLGPQPPQGQRAQGSCFRTSEASPARGQQRSSTWLVSRTSWRASGAPRLWKRLVLRGEDRGPGRALQPPHTRAGLPGDLLVLSPSCPLPRHRACALRCVLGLSPSPRGQTGEEGSVTLPLMEVRLVRPLAGDPRWPPRSPPSRAEVSLSGTPLPPQCLALGQGRGRFSPLRQAGPPGVQGPLPKDRHWVRRRRRRPSPAAWVATCPQGRARQAGCGVPSSPS